MPVNLTVNGVPEIAVSTDSIDFGQVMVGGMGSDTFLIANVGCDTLFIDSLVSDHAAFIPDSLMGAAILPGDTLAVGITFSPADTVNYNGILTIFNNDQNVAIALLGQGIPAPAISVIPTNINVHLTCGDSVIVPVQIINSGAVQLDWNATTDLSSSISDDFDPGVDLSVWQDLQNAIASTNCGSVSGNALHFTGDGTRSATTIDLSVLSGGNIEFNLRFGTGGSPCENADGGEDVVLEYSTNGGASWTNINTYDTEAFTAFNLISEIVPPAAQTSNTRFRWRQISHSGDDFDVWSMDNVSIGTDGGNLITVIPDSGAVAIADTQTVDVKLNAKDALGGSYNNIITITSNDPVNPTVGIAVSIQITDLAVPALSDTALVFGSVILGNSGQQSFAVSYTHLRAHET